MGNIINLVQFDILFIQYYNTPQCSAREWVSSNPGYGVSTSTENASGFKENFDALVASLPTSKSNGTKLYIGLLGSMSAGISGDYLDPTSEVAPLIEAHFCNPYFGGIMIFEAGYAENNVGADGKTFYEEVKDTLVSDSTDTQQFTCATTGTPTRQASSPTGGTGTGTGSEQTTEITMTICPSSPGSLLTSIIYGNSTTRSYSNYTSVYYSNSSSYPTALSPAAVTSTTVSLLPSTTPPSTTATPTYTFNLNSTTPSPTRNGSDCFVVIVTMSVSFATAPCISSQPIATGVTTSGSSPLSVGSNLFLLFAVGVPGAFGILWYMLGKVLL
jgi:chitinase